MITDLYSTIYGGARGPILRALQSHKPDLVLMTGDITDHKVPHKGTLLLLESPKGQYPCYYVAGNHEHWIHQTPDIKKMFTGYGITVLRGQTVHITIKGQPLIIGGVNSPHTFTNSHHSIKLGSRWKRQFWRCYSRTSPVVCSILPSHRPEFTKCYRDNGFDLTVASHTHEGQVRTPGCSGGLLTSHQGFLSQYAGGQYALGTASLIVSRELCISRLPRIYSPLELMLVDLNPIS